MKKLLAIVLSVAMFFSVMATVYVTGNTTYSYNTVQDFDGFAENEISRANNHLKNEKGIKTKLVKSGSSIATTKGNTSASTGEFIAYGKDGSTGFKAWANASGEYIEVYVPVTAQMRQGAVGFRVWAYNRSIAISGFQLRFYAQKDGVEYVYRKSGYTMDKLQDGYLELFFNDPEIGKHSQTPNYTNVADPSKVPDVSSYNMSEDLTYIGVMVSTSSTGAMGFDNFEIISSDAPVAETTVPTEEETTSTTVAPQEPSEEVEIIAGGEWVEGFWRNGAIDTAASEASNNKRVSYNVFLKVTPNTTYTITTKLNRNSTVANAINFKEYNANKEQVANTNFHAYTLGTDFTEEVTVSATTEYITISLWSSFDSTQTGTDLYKNILNGLANGNIAVSIKGAGTVTPEVPSSSSTTTTTTTVAPVVEDYEIEDVAVATNWRIGTYDWQTGAYDATNTVRACLKQLVKVDPAKTYVIDAKGADGLFYAIREYNADKTMINSISKHTFGSKYVASSQVVAYIGITMYDGSPLNKILNGTILPSMVEFVEAETSSTTTTTTTTTTTAPVQPPVYDGETAVKELITDDNWVQGFWTTTGLITTETSNHRKRAAYNKYMKVLPNTTYTIKVKMSKTYALNFKELDGNKQYLSLNTNKTTGDLGANFTTTLTTGPNTSYLVVSTWNTNENNMAESTSQTIINNYLDDTFTLSIVGEVPVDALEVGATMIKGAALRLGDVNGLRYYTTVDAEKIAKLQQEGATVEVGTLIAPKDILGRDELTFDLDSAKYLDVTFDLSKGYYQDGNVFVGSIANIKESNTAYSKESGNISRKFVGRGYVKVTKDGRTFISYATYEENKVANNARSLKVVATSLRNDPTQVALYEAFKDSVDKWADAILGEISVTDEMVGGNIIVQNIEENADGSYTVTLKNDLRTTTSDWFYWAFKVEGAGGKKVTFKFSQSHRVGYYGAAVSKDLENWAWTNTKDGEGFTYNFGKDDTTVYFAHHMLYHPDRFYDLADELNLDVKTLCTSEKGRAVPYVKFGNGDKGIVLTARHHACESSGSYVLEGVLRQLASSDYIKENYTVMVVPFMDIDGVIEGDQGKGRAPHDHNQDYIGGWGNTDSSIYASVRAVRKYVENPANNVVQAYDSHSPWHIGGDNDSIFVYKKFAPGTERADNLETLLTMFKNNIDSSCLTYNGANNQEYGVAGNAGTDGTVGKGFSTYMTNIPTLICGTTFETAFFRSNGKQFTQENAVNTGKALGKAIVELSKTLDE